MTATTPAMRPLPRAMLIDMGDTLLWAYARPEVAWNTIANESAEEIAPLPAAAGRDRRAGFCAKLLGQCGSRVAAEARRD